MNQARIQPFKPQHPDERFRSPASAIARDFSGGLQRLTRCDPREPAWPQSAGVIFERVVVSCIVSWLHFVYGAAINRRSSVMHRAPFSAWQGVMVPHVMWCAGHRPRATDGAASRPCSIGWAASRPYSINAAVWLAFVAVNVFAALRQKPVFEDSRNAACSCLRIVRIAHGP